MAMAFPLQIFFDGSCAICRAEMEVYRRKNPDNRLVFIDISAADFQPRDFGKTLEDFMAQLHVRDAAGRFATGADAFIAIWQAFPSGSVQRLLAALLGLPGVHLLGRGGYRVFARYRHLLPRRRQVCESDHCSVPHPSSDAVNDRQRKL